MSGPDVVPARRELTNLQALRALAAGLVLLHHAAVHGKMLRGNDRPFPILDDRMGSWGVSIFFALSGFLMAGLVTRDPPLVFLAHRIGRIFPTYLAVVAVSAAVFASLGTDLGGISVLALSLAPAGPRSYPLTVEWSLVFEVGFYLGLFLLAAAGLARFLVPVAGGWIVLLVAVVLLDPSLSRDVLPPAYRLPLAAACLPFAAGLLLPRLIAAGWIGPRAALLVPPLAAASLVLDPAASRWLGGVAAVLLVGTAVSVPQVRRDRPGAGALVALGNWSYVLYLVHPPVLMLTYRACPPQWPGFACAGLGIAGALGVSALLGPLDVAAYRHLRRYLDGLSPRTLRSVATAFLIAYAGCAAWGSGEVIRNDRADGRVRRALAALPDEAWTSPARASALIAAGGLALPSSLRAALEETAPLGREETVIRAYAFDPARPQRALHLALFCGGHLLATDRPRRMRRDLGVLPGFGGRRIGFVVRIPARACDPRAVLAVVVDEEGPMAMLMRTGLAPP